ncbi:hypothetical protein GCM10027161_71080 [Microbispora hainanensis]
MFPIVSSTPVSRTPPPMPMTGVRVDGDRTLQREMHRWFERYAFTPEALGLTPLGH